MSSPLCVYELISGYVVNNTTVYAELDVIFLDKKLHVSAGSGHHQVAACLMRRSAHETRRHANCVE